MKSDFNLWIDKEFEQLDAAFHWSRPARPIRQRSNVPTTTAPNCAMSAARMGYELVTFIARTLCEILEAFIAGATYDQNVISCHMEPSNWPALKLTATCVPMKCPK